MTATRAHERIIKHLITNRHLFRIFLITRSEICTAFTFLGIYSHCDSPCAAYIQYLDIVPESFFAFSERAFFLLRKDRSTTTAASPHKHHHRSQAGIAVFDFPILFGGGLFLKPGGVEYLIVEIGGRETVRDWPTLSLS